MENKSVIKIFGGHLVNQQLLKNYPIMINAGVHEGQEMADLINIVPNIIIYALEPSERCYYTALQKFNSYKNINFIKKK